MRITISGPPGSGKTTVCKLIAERLDLKVVISGNIFRQMARESRMSLADFGRTELALAEHEMPGVLAIRAPRRGQAQVSGWSIAPSPGESCSARGGAARPRAGRGWCASRYRTRQQPT